MWSEKLADQFIQTRILTRRASSPFLKEPVLLIIDSYPGHLPLAGRYEKHNVYIRFIPKNMTGLLQPLDVCFNRYYKFFICSSLQASYETSYDQWLIGAIDNPEMRTANGNLKMPSHSLVSDWIAEFKNKVDAELIKKAFRKCGIGHDLSEEDYHPALKELVSSESLGDETEQWELAVKEMEASLALNSTLDDYYLGFPMIDNGLVDDDPKSFYRIIAEMENKSTGLIQEEIIEFIKVIILIIVRMMHCWQS